jgi:hypothetical protein
MRERKKERQAEKERNERYLQRVILHTTLTYTYCSNITSVLRITLVQIHECPGVRGVRHSSLRDSGRAPHI